ncbi:hypothetical protein OPT61_g4345 [Boeremia exigua]|uniref:Uncharacterized protein n=1 Tax=Boeremia exigua TaxID=749465 RepID=A0ACC2IEB5_9PLEO|nr:hypothetical protein OPT61_g4345 [Boeremia exigua]
MLSLNDRHDSGKDFAQVPLPKVLESVPDEGLVQQFSDLYSATLIYVKKFYTDGPIRTGGASQMMIEQANSGVLLPWPQILDLLRDRKTRLGILVMCIGRVILSRILLLKLATSNSLGATLLPPEVVDCFQSFCIGRSALTMDGKEPKPLNLALLSRWKQITATLLYSTYVEEAFSPFDARTINIERAMEDLGPLLNIYAIPGDAGFHQGSRPALFVVVRLVPQPRDRSLRRPAAPREGACSKRSGAQWKLAVLPAAVRDRDMALFVEGSGL